MLAGRPLGRWQIHLRRLRGKGLENNHANISHDDSGEPLPFYKHDNGPREITSDGLSKTYVTGSVYADDPAR